MAITDLNDWILGSFATVDEVKTALEGIKVWGDKVAKLGNEAPTVHIAVHDMAGKSLVIEFVGGKKQVYDNYSNVMTNAPPLPWHLINLRNYLQLNALDPASKTVDGQIFASPGTGAGLVGLPGDWTPPSRFLRDYVMVAFSKTTPDAKSAVNLASHIINATDIPMGMVREKTSTGIAYDYTQWAVIRDQRNLVLYYRMYDDLGFKAYPLSKYDISEGAKPQSVSIK
jgi:choloylglycine hydrolase